MAYHQVNNIIIKGISACVPKISQKTEDLEIFTQAEAESFVKNTGIKKRHIAENATCASDMCFIAAEDLIKNLNWDKNEIDVLVFVSQTPDYILPSTSNILQNRLSLSKECFCIDINLGCSAYIYGLSVISNLLQNKSFKKGILLVGDTISQFSSPKDKSVYPLFGDAGTASALEFENNSKSIMSFETGSDGSGEDAIKITHGGSRNKFNEASLKYFEIEGKASYQKRNIDLFLNGVDVFNFAIKTAPATIKKLLERLELTTDQVDWFVLHQANLFMNETIRKKLKVDSEKMLSSISDFGNTNGASIPLTLCHNFSNIIEKGNLVLCGFGVGLSWGALHYNNENKIITNLLYL